MVYPTLRVSPQRINMVVTPVLTIRVQCDYKMAAAAAAMVTIIYCREA